jgi:hypothetical protein
VASISQTVIRSLAVKIEWEGGSLNLNKTLLAPAMLAASLMLPTYLAAQSDSAQSTTLVAQAQTDESKPCHWWQFKRCEETKTIEGLPPEAPHQGTIITVDVSTNTAYLFNDGSLVAKAPAATGTGKTLKKGRKIWMFHTPRGRLTVLRKIEDPVWTKPDWAFVEAGEPIPPRDSPKRQVRGHLGKYALDLGDGIMIHGTDEIDSLGRKASHGCVRLPADMLDQVYHAAKIGTEVYIFESDPQPMASATTATNNQPGQVEHHSDLDIR